MNRFRDPETIVWLVSIESEGYALPFLFKSVKNESKITITCLAASSN